MGLAKRKGGGGWVKEGVAVNGRGPALHIVEGVPFTPSQMDTEI